MEDSNEHKKPPKELIELLEKRLYIKPIGIEIRLKEVQETIEKSITPGKKRFKELEKQLDKKFPPNTPKRGAANGITYFLFDSAFELYFIGNNSALFIELQGLLERFCIDKACEFIAVDDNAMAILIDSFSKKTLNDIAEYFQTISLWTAEEVNFAKKLTHIRNGIAHKNAKLVSKHLGDGQKKMLTSIDDITKKADAIPYIIQTIELIVKVADGEIPTYFSNPRFKGRLEAYSSIIGLILNLFCDREFISLPNPVKFTMLNRLFGKSFLLGSEELKVLLREFKTKVIEFHDLLGIEETKSKDLHKELVVIGNNIYEEMRRDLQVDGDSKVFIKPRSIEIDFDRIKRNDKN
ncbi:hypothetical protein G9H64_07705 [Aquirufa nivalisilvae]|uniref:hypothetical protein n=1 Tax=Aquirufa nivalisilvae TaxID=2516557 RepID=UPI0022A9DBD2|nr:hypothetical protein [Aquirufa nivalisilvae]MCZ2482839.1 hypothetical protein [Aquirufa nivalisilvae]